MSIELVDYPEREKRPSDAILCNTYFSGQNAILETILENSKLETEREASIAVTFPMPGIPIGFTEIFGTFQQMRMFGDDLALQIQMATLLTSNEPQIAKVRSLVGLNNEPILFDGESHGIVDPDNAQVFSDAKYLESIIDRLEENAGNIFTSRIYREVSAVDAEFFYEGNPDVDDDIEVRSEKAKRSVKNFPGLSTKRVREAVEFYEGIRTSAEEIEPGLGERIIFLPISSGSEEQKAVIDKNQRTMGTGSKNTRVPEIYEAYLDSLQGILNIGKSYQAKLEMLERNMLSIADLGLHRFNDLDTLGPEELEIIIQSISRSDDVVVDKQRRYPAVYRHAARLLNDQVVGDELVAELFMREFLYQDRIHTSTGSNRVNQNAGVLIGSIEMREALENAYQFILVANRSEYLASALKGKGQYLDKFRRGLKYR